MNCSLHCHLKLGMYQMRITGGDICYSKIFQPFSLPCAVLHVNHLEQAHALGQTTVQVSYPSPLLHVRGLCHQASTRMRTSD